MDGLNWEDLPWGKGVRILKSAVDWVAVEKPVGVLSHPNEGGDAGRSVLSAEWNPGDETYRIGKGFGLGLCHRLDAPTSGVLLLAGGEALGWFRRAFEEGRMRKKYLAVVVGRPGKPRFVWRDRLSRRRSGNQVRVEISRNGVEAETEGREIGFRRTAIPLSLLELRPATGRTHQLRVQAAKSGLPVLGDRNYGDFRANRAFQKSGGSRRLFLHAVELSWERGGTRTTVEAPVGEEFRGIFS